MLLDSVEDKKDLWLIYELCPGKTMNEHLFEVKGEFYKGERIYMVHHGNFLEIANVVATAVRHNIARAQVQPQAARARSYPEQGTFKSRHQVWSLHQVARTDRGVSKLAHPATRDVVVL